MKNDFGFYGSGMSGYVHYRQAMDESKRSRYTGKGPLPPAKPSSQEDDDYAFAVTLFIVFVGILYLLLKFAS